ncbi:MAG: coiled-coil protein [Methanosarcinales archaeon Met12]|nr:MAG: coiled-coil protein [Methanosarcinales archaeon Met12]
MLEDLQNKMGKLLEEADKHKKERNRWNAHANISATRRNELNDKTKKLVEQAQQFKENRDGYNQNVRDLKKKRDEYNNQANSIYANLDSLRKKSNAGGGMSLNKLRQDIDALEFKQQTEVLSIDKERQLVEKISALQEEFLKRKEQLEQDEEFKAQLKTAQKLRDGASECHDKLTEYANMAQEQHDKMLSTFKEVDKIRAEADAMHMEFIKAQEIADNAHHMYIGQRREMRDISKLIIGLKRNEQNIKEVEMKAEANKVAEKLYDKFKKGEKLSTEDLFILQRSDML